MPSFLRTFLDTVREIDARSAIDILLIAVIIYALLLLLRGTTAMSLLRGGAILFVAAFVLANTFNLAVLNWLLRNSLASLLLAATIIFQPEIRRALERVGRTRVPALRTRPAMDTLVDAIVGSCRELAVQRHGALIVVERETGLEDYIATGRRIDALPSAELLSAIFYRNAPLHDGAVLIRGDRIVAAGCTLPLADVSPDGFAGLAAGGHTGTRHRAGLGITERTDAVSVLVSEETGDISLAAGGRLMSRLDETRLRALLLSTLDSRLRARGLPSEGLGVSGPSPQAPSLELARGGDPPGRPY